MTWQAELDVKNEDGEALYIRKNIEANSKEEAAKIFFAKLSMGRYKASDFDIVDNEIVILNEYR